MVVVSWVLYSVHIFVTTLKYINEITALSVWMHAYYGRFFYQWKSIKIDNQSMKSHSKTRHRSVIDYRYQSINWYLLISIGIDSHRLSTSSIKYAGLFRMRNLFHVKFYVPDALKPIDSYMKCVIINYRLRCIRYSQRLKQAFSFKSESPWKMRDDWTHVCLLYIILFFIIWQASLPVK